MSTQTQAGGLTWSSAGVHALCQQTELGLLESQRLQQLGLLESWSLPSSFMSSVLGVANHAFGAVRLQATRCTGSCRAWGGCGRPRSGGYLAAAPGLRLSDFLCYRTMQQQQPRQWLLAPLANPSIRTHCPDESAGRPPDADRRLILGCSACSTAGAQDPSQWLKGTYYDTHARAKAKRAGSTGLGSTGDVTKKAM